MTNDEIEPAVNVVAKLLTALVNTLTDEGTTVKTSDGDTGAPPMYADSV
jgi:hypothetical protein